MTSQIKNLKGLFEMKEIFANAILETYTPGQQWINMSESERKKILNTLLKTRKNFEENFEVILAKDDGQVIVKIIKILKASERGTLLLDLEELYKLNIDKGINLWVEALGDKNTLRNLRGIEVKHV